MRVCSAFESRGISTASGRRGRACKGGYQQRSSGAATTRWLTTTPAWRRHRTGCPEIGPSADHAQVPSRAKPRASRATRGLYAAAGAYVVTASCRSATANTNIASGTWRKPTSGWRANQNSRDERDRGAARVGRGASIRQNRKASDMVHRTRRVRRPSTFWSDLLNYIVIIAVVCVCFVFLYLYVKSLVR